MGNIVLTRIDSRLIHGQVMTKWVNQSEADKIVIVSDDLAQDKFMLEIYLLSAPGGISIICYSKQDAVKEWRKNNFGDGNILLLFPNLISLKEVYDNGLKIQNIQIGGLGGAPDRKAVFQNITLDDTDVDILKYLDGKNVEIIFQTIPEDIPKNFKEIIKKY